MYTKKGNIRKRKLFEQTLAERKKRKTEERAASHGVKLSCDTKTSPSTSNSISCKTPIEEQPPRDQTSAYTRISEREDHLTTGIGTSPKFSNKPLKTYSRKRMPENFEGSDESEDIEILNCYNTTFSKKLAIKVKTMCKNERACAVLFDEIALKPKLDYNESFDYIEGQAVASMNISFANLGNEEWFECERFNLHSKSSLHKKEDPDIDCNECCSWKQHKEKYVAAREEYERDKKERQPEKLIVSADLQKVIMLPRAEMFKEVIFTPRVIAFNESFVPVGAYSKGFKPLAVIWHEGSGHTFMSADAFHHQVELSLKESRKVLDFDDFKSAVQQSNSSKVNVKEMKIEDFFQWKDYSSKFKLQKVTPKPYLKNMVHLRFKRGENIVHYKNQFAGEFIPLNFLSAEEQKGGIKKPPCFTQHRGIDKEI
nr:unnamed protein product [Callosobruchus chinensis]